MSPIGKESPAAAHRGNRLPIIANANFFIGGQDPKLKQFQKAVDHFLWGEYDKMHDDDQYTSPGLISKWIINDDGFGFEDEEIKDHLDD